MRKSITPELTAFLTKLIQTPARRGERVLERPQRLPVHLPRNLNTRHRLEPLFPRMRQNPRRPVRNRIPLGANISLTLSRKVLEETLSLLKRPSSLIDKLPSPARRRLRQFLQFS